MHISLATRQHPNIKYQRRLRSVDRAFVGSFLLVLFVFYAIGTGAALKGIAPE